MKHTTWNIPTKFDTTTTILLEPGTRVYILGPNGSGKSALVQHLSSKILDRPIRRISAHRRTWIQSGALDFTAKSRKAWAQNQSQWNQRADARWLDYDPAAKQSAVLFDLVTQDNYHAQLVRRLVNDQNLDEAVSYSANNPPLFDTLNKLLDLGKFPVAIENSKNEELIAQHRKGNQDTYDIARMSDGERSAVILAANILTAEENTVFVIDEPERHLHRAIMEPFLSALFSHRTDCSFVIATHELALPAADPESAVLMIRSCLWGAAEWATEWDLTFLPSDSPLPEDLRRAILGSRRKVLFVEGTSRSLDRPLYEALFPTVSVVPVGNCHEVQHVVDGLRKSEVHHNIRAYGIIDNDDRPADSINKLAAKGVFVLNTLSVEGLYYCSEAIETVAHHRALTLNFDNSDEILANARKNALKALDHDDVISYMAARRSERLIRNQALDQLPKSGFLKSSTDESYTIILPSPMPNELQQIRTLISNGDIDGLVKTYPIRESRAFDGIATALRCSSANEYRRMVVERIRTNADLREALTRRMHSLASTINSENGGDVTIV